MDKNEISKTISCVKLEDEVEHEHNIEYMVQDDDYKLPWKIKDAEGFKAVTDSIDRAKLPLQR